MRRVLKISILILSIILVYIGYIPINSNGELNTFLSSNFWWFKWIGWLLIFLILIQDSRKNGKKNIWFNVIILLVIIPSFFDSWLTAHCNNYVIAKNSGKSLSNIENYILGYRLEKVGNKAKFIYNDNFFTYDALVFEHNHNIVIDFENKSEVKKIIDKDWWVYSHQD